MKNALIAAVLMAGLIGSARAADFGELAVSVGELRAAIARGDGAAKPPADGRAMKAGSPKGGPVAAPVRISASPEDSRISDQEAYRRDSMDVSRDTLTEFGSACSLGRSSSEAMSNAMLMLNQPVVRQQTNISVWTGPHYSGAYVQAPYRVLGEATVTRISIVSKANWLACIPVQGRIR